MVKKEEHDEAVQAADKKLDDDDSDSSVSSEEDGDDMVLEGVLRRNPDASDSDDSDDDDDDDKEEKDDDDEDDDKEEEDSKPPPAKKSKGNDKGAKPAKNNNKKKGKKKKGSDDLEIVPVEFTFCDMDEKYFHGLKTMLTSISPIYAAQSSELSDLMIENASVGTVVGCDMAGDPDTVFGFASVLNVTTFQHKASIQALKTICLDQCPADRKTELTTVLSGKTKRPAAFYLHGRMVNLPLEIVEVLHQQLVMDMDWAVKNAENVDRKSLDFGVFVRLAPSYRSGGGTSGSEPSCYKYFDDEVFADHADFTYEIKIPKTFGMEETPYCMVIVLTKTGYRAAMKAMAKLVNGGSV
jgi:hypothetical protein